MEREGGSVERAGAEGAGNKWAVYRDLSKQYPFLGIGTIRAAKELGLGRKKQYGMDQMRRNCRRINC